MTFALLPPLTKGIGEMLAQATEEVHPIPGQIYLVVGGDAWSRVIRACKYCSADKGSSEGPLPYRQTAIKIMPN